MALRSLRNRLDRLTARIGLGPLALDWGSGSGSGPADVAGSAWQEAREQGLDPDEIEDRRVTYVDAIEADRLAPPEPGTIKLRWADDRAPEPQPTASATAVADPDDEPEDPSIWDDLLLDDEPLDWPADAGDGQHDHDQGDDARTD